MSWALIPDTDLIESICEENSKGSPHMVANEVDRESPRCLLAAPVASHRSTSRRFTSRNSLNDGGFMRLMPCRRHCRAAPASPIARDDGVPDSEVPAAWRARMDEDPPTTT